MTFCPQCGTNSPAGVGYCQKCGASLYWASPGSTGIPVAAVQPYAGFWIRVAATLIDGVVQGIIVVPLVILLGLHLAEQLKHVTFNDSEPFLPIFIFIVTLFSAIVMVEWLYEALLTSSTWQGTVGKHLLGLRVTDLAGNPIDFARSTGRFFAKFLSRLCFSIGYIMVAFTERKQGLHDILAGTLVWKQ